MSIFGCCDSYNEHHEDCVTNELKRVTAERDRYKKALENIVKLSNSEEDWPIEVMCNKLYKEAVEALRE